MKWSLEGKALEMNLMGILAAQEDGTGKQVPANGAGGRSGEDGAAHAEEELELPLRSRGGLASAWLSGGPSRVRG